MERAREKQHQSPGHQGPDAAKSSVAHDFQHHNPYTNYYSFFAVLLLLTLNLAPLLHSQFHSSLLTVSPSSSLPLVHLLSCCNQSSIKLHQLGHLLLLLSPVASTMLSIPPSHFILSIPLVVSYIGRFQ